MSSPAVAANRNGLPPALGRSKVDKRYNDINEKLRVARIYIQMLIATNDSNVQPWNAKPKKPNYLTPKSLAAAAGISKGSAFRLVTELRTYGGVVEKQSFLDDKAFQGRPTLYLPVIDETINTANAEGVQEQGTIIPPAQGAPKPKGSSGLAAAAATTNSEIDATQIETAIHMTSAAFGALHRQQYETAQDRLQQALQHMNQRFKGGDRNPLNHPKAPPPTAAAASEAPAFAPPIPPPTRPPAVNLLGKRRLPTAQGEEEDGEEDGAENTSLVKKYVRGSSVDDYQYNWKKVQKRVMWTEAEDEALRQGFEKFGRQYQLIKDHAPGRVLDRRTNVQLKDHVKLLIKKGLLEDQPYHGHANSAAKRQRREEEEEEQQHHHPPAHDEAWAHYKEEEDDDEEEEEEEDSDDGDVANLGY